MKKKKEYRKIIDSCNWDRININDDFWKVPLEIRELIWKESKNNSIKQIKRKE